MKRRIISAILLIVMLISLVPAQAFAQETTADEPETLPEAQQIPAEETIPDEEVEIIPMPDAEYEEIIEEPAEEPAEEPEDEESAEKVSVRFDLTPAELTLRVYHAEEYTAAEPQPIAPEADGTYLLLPGEYCYDAECEGYIPVYNCAFTVSESTEIAVALEADSESTVSGTSTAIASGSCGENLTWTLDENGVLTISGTGAMADYGLFRGKPAPWHEHRDKIKTVLIESGVTSISWGAFNGCTALTSIEVASGNEYYSVLDGVLFNKSATELVCFPAGRAGDYTIPNGVISVCKVAFGGCTALTSVTIPDSVTSIGNLAFAECYALESVTIPNSVTSIADGAFSGCTALTDVYYTGTRAQWSAISIGNDNEPLTNATIHYAAAIIASGSCGENLTWALDENGALTISGTGAMTDYEVGTAPWLEHSDKIKTVVIESGVTSVGDHAFNYCSKITAVTIPDSVTSIGNYALNASSLTSIEVAVGNEHYSSLDGVLFNKDATELVRFPGGRAGTYTIPDSVTSIGWGAFFGCTSLTNVTIPESVTGIDAVAFHSCTALTNVTIPTSVTSIGVNVFYGCRALMSIEVASGNEYYSSIDGVLFNKDATEFVRFPAGRAGDYTIPNGVISIGYGAFSGCTALTYVTIPDSVTSIDYGAFLECTALTDVTIPDRVTSIGDYAFFKCTTLKYVTIGDRVTSIGDYAFFECTALTDVYYTGTKAQWSAISIGNDNEPLTNATIHYASGSCGENLTWTLNESGVLTISGTGDMEDYEENCEGIAMYNPNTPWEKYIEEIKAVVIESGVTSVGDNAFRGCFALASVTIPEGVTRIGVAAFYGCALTSVTIPDSVTSIGNLAFGGCAALTSVAIPDSVTSIGLGIFASCNALTNIEVASGNEFYSAVDGVLFNKDATELVCYPAGRKGAYTIPSNVTSIGNNAFSGCNALTGVTIPSSVTSIGSNAFSGCDALTSVAIPDSVTNIGWGIFASCNALTNIEVASGNEYYSVLDGVLFNKDATELVCFPAGRAGAYTIPDSVTSIDDYAFWDCNALTCITIPVSVTEIGKCVFCFVETQPDVYYTGTQEQWDAITIDPSNEYFIYVYEKIHFAPAISGSCGENLTWTLDENGTLTISGTGEMTDNRDGTDSPWYTYIERIKTVEIKSGVTSIGNCAFSGCPALTSVTIPDSVTSISWGAFSECTSLTSVTIPDSVTSIGGCAFCGCTSLTNVTIPDSVTSIGDTAFCGCTALADVYYTGTRAQWSAISIGAENEPLTNATIHYASGSCGENLTWTLDENGVLTISGTGDMEYIGEWSAYREKITDVIISDGVASIYASAFECFTALESVTIADSVTVIGDGAFFECSALESIVLPDGLNRIGVQLFTNCYNLRSVTVPTGVASIGEGAFYQCRSLESITIPASATSIEGRAFTGCVSLTSVVIPDSVASIGNYAFNYCTSLTSVTIGSSTAIIGDYAFSECWGLESLLIGNSVLSIGEGAFSNCDALTSVTIPDSVTSINNSTFYDCNALTSVTIGSSVRSIGNYAFKYCTSLTSVTIPDSVTSIGDNAFNNCTALTSVTIPNSVISIGNSTFYGCSALTSVTIPDSVTSIGAFAFSGCNALTSVTIPESVSYIGYAAFGKNTSLADVYYSGSPFLWSKVNIQDGNSDLTDATIHYGREDESGSCGENLTWRFDAESGVLTISGTGDMDNYAVSNIVASSTTAPWYMYDVASVVIEEGVAGIGDYAFWNMRDIISISVPSTVSRIGEHAFDCPTVPYTNHDRIELGMVSSLQRIDVAADNAVFSSADGILFSKSGDIVIKYPAGRENTGYTLPVGVSEIADYAFYGAAKLTSVTMLDGIKKIGESAFSRCASLTSVTIPNGVTSISGDAFSYCRALTSVTIPNGVISIGEFAFYDCASLPSVTIPSSVKDIGDYAFGVCEKLTSVTIPNGVTNIADGAFQHCTALTSVTIPSSVTSISNWAFYNCTALADVYYLGTKAQWDAISIGAENEPLLNAVIHTGYMVSYDANGGEGAPAAQVKEKGKALKLSTVIPTRRHFTFLGWAVSKTATGAQYKAGASYTKDADVTLYAVWKPVLATKITVTPATAALCGANRTLELTASVLPAEADDTVTWSSSNEKIATVDENGVVTTHGVYGTVTITAAAADGSRRTGKCTLTVKSPLTEALTIRDSDGAECNGKAVFLPLISGSKYQYTAERTPADSASAVKWTSSNARVVTVSAAGLVSVKGVGSAVITAKSADTNAASASFTVSVVNFTPTLSAKTVTINSFFDNGTDISVTCAPDSSLMSLELCTKSGSSYVPLDKIDVEDMGEAGFRLRAVEAKRASYSAFAKAVLFCEGVGYVNYYLPLRIAVVNTAPTVRVTGEKINTFYPGWEWGITPKVKGGTVEHYELEADSNPNFELTDGGKLRLSEAGMAAVMANPRASIVRTPVKLVFSFENTKNTVTVSYRPTVVFSKPTARITLEKINPFYVERAWNVTPTVTNGKLDYYEVENNGNEILTVNGEDKIVLTAAAKALVRSNPKARLSSGALKFILHFEDTPITQEISVRPSIAVSTPRFAARDAQTGKAVSYVTFNRFFNADAVEFELYDGASKAAVTPGSCTVSDPVQVFGTYSDGSTIGITCNDYAAKKSRAVLEFASEDWLTPVKLTMHVRYAAAPKMTLTASGRIDLINRAGTGITYTPRFTNAAGSVMQGMKLETVKDYAGNDVTDAFELVYDHGTGKAALRANEGSALVKKAYSVTVSAELALGEEICTVYTTVRVTPVQTALRLKASAMKIKQGGSAGIVIETVPAGCELASAEVIVPAVLTAGLSAVIDKDTKLLTVTAARNFNPGTYTLTVTALPKDAAVGTAPTKLTVRVTVVKTH